MVRFVAGFLLAILWAISSILEWVIERVAVLFKWRYK